MFNDIEELEREIETFKTNIHESNKLCDLLQSVSADIKKSQDDINLKYDKFTQDIINIKANIEKQSNNLMDDFSNSINEQQAFFDKKYETFISSLEVANNKIEEQSNKNMQNNIELLNQQKEDMEIKLTEVINHINKQQALFEKSSNEITDKLNNMQLDNLLKAINKANSKINLVYIGIGIVIVLNLIKIIFK